MNIFGNTAAGFSKEVDNAMSTFKSTITKEKEDDIYGVVLGIYTDYLFTTQAEA